MEKKTDEQCILKELSEGNNTYKRGKKKKIVAVFEGK